VLPGAVMQLLEAAAEVGRRVDRELFLAGGAVRDVLLGRPTEDIDLVVAPSAEPLVEALAQALDASVESESRFRTWRLALANGRRLDIAEARRETYSAPGALPTTVPATLEADLGRRDFSINAMAVALGPTWSGPIDPHDGARDLAAGKLRTLHPTSFKDDPSRVLRGLELGQRFGFEFDRSTGEAARRTLADGGLQTLSPARFRTAWRRSFGRLVERGRPALVAGLETAQNLGLLRALGVNLGPLMLSAADRLARRAKSESSDRVENSHLLIRALARDDVQVARRMATLWSAQEDVRASWASFAAKAESLRGKASELERPSQVAAALEGFDSEEMAVLDLLVNPDIDALLATYRQQVEPLRLTVAGRDLIARGYTPGPEIGAALEALREARLDGLITADEELEYACARLSPPST